MPNEIAARRRGKLRACVGLCSCLCGFLVRSIRVLPVVRPSLRLFPFPNPPSPPCVPLRVSPHLPPSLTWGRLYPPRSLSEPLSGRKLFTAMPVVHRVLSHQARWSPATFS